MLNIQQHQVVQLNPETTKNPAFAGCLFVVSDVKSWGAQGYVQSLGTREAAGGQAYYRATWEEMATLENGIAPFVVE